MLIGILGWVAAVLGVVVSLPQVVRLVRTRDTSGLSLVYWQACVGAIAGWLVHGLYIREAPMIATNAWAVILYTAGLVLIGRIRRLGWLRLIGPAAVLAAVLAVVNFLLPSVYFGVAAVLPSVYGLVGQARQLVRAPAITGVSPAFLALNAVNQWCWFWWALLLPDNGTIVSGATAGTLMGFNFVWWLLRRCGLPALGGGHVDSPHGPATAS
jgi:MtN3 and saliva related transmembrane protein